MPRSFDLAKISSFQSIRIQTESPPPFNHFAERKKEKKPRKCLVVSTWQKIPSHVTNRNSGRMTDRFRVDSFRSGVCNNVCRPVIGILFLFAPRKYRLDALCRHASMHHRLDTRPARTHRHAPPTNNCQPVVGWIHNNSVWLCCGGTGRFPAAPPPVLNSTPRGPGSGTGVPIWPDREKGSRDNKQIVWSRYDLEMCKPFREVWMF